MRRFLVATIAAGLVVAACGDGAMSADEYFAAVQGAAVTYDEAVSEISRMYARALDETIADFAASGASVDDAAALGALAGQAASQAMVALGGTGVALEQYGKTVSSLAPPGSAEAAHGEFVASLAASLAAIEPTIDVLVGVSTVDELGPAVAGSPYSDSRFRLERACVTLQSVGETSGVAVDLRCVSTESGVDGAP